MGKYLKEFTLEELRDNLGLMYKEQDMLNCKITLFEKELEEKLKEVNK